MLDVDLKLAVPQPAERFLKHRDVKPRFAAEVMIDHPRVAARLLDDAVYARAGKAMGDEFARRGAQYLFAAFRRLTPPPPARTQWWSAETRRRIGGAITHM